MSAKFKITNQFTEIISGVIFFVLTFTSLQMYSQTMFVNEIMFKPGPTVTGCDQKLFVRVPNNNNMSQSCGREYIELYNSDCNNDYDLSGYVLGSCQATSGIYENGGAFAFPPGTIVPAGGFLIVGGPDEDDGGNGAFTYTIGSIDIKLSTFQGTNYIATVSNGYWFLPNVDGWMALYEPSGDIHSAVYWTTQVGNILTVAEFESAPPAPAAYTGAPLKSAKEIYQTSPALIQWVGAATATNTGNTLSRIPDGGSFQANRPQTIGPNRPDRCNDGTCLACGNLTVTGTPDTCSASVGTIELAIPSPQTSPPPYIFTVTGPAGYSNSFSSSSNPYLLSGLAAGAYSVTVVDNFSPPNTTIRTVTLDDIAGATITTSSTPDNCNTSTGSASVTVSGGMSPYTYNWQNYPANNSATLSNIPAGTYNITVTGQNGTCPVSSTITVSNTGSVTATISSTNDVCAQHNGTATVAPSQPAAQCSFLWGPGGQTTQTATGLTAGNYTCTVTYNGCSVTAQTTVGASGTIAATISGTNPLCNGQSNGSVNTTVSQGVSPYTYLWSNGATTSAITNTAAGSYSVTITTSAGCSTTLNHSLTNPVSIASQISQTVHVLCYNGQNGSATVTATGGTAPYSYVWTGGSTSSTTSNLTAGSYTVTVSDQNNCTSVSNANINQPSVLNSTITNNQDVTCYNGNNGSATVTATGGTPPYTYAWTNGQHGQTSTDMGVGSYNVIVNDANYCTSSASGVIGNAIPITVTIPQGQVGCSGNSNGVLTPVVSGGATPYSYFWSNGQSASSATGLTIGIYNLTVTDANGCNGSGNGSVVSPSAVMIGIPQDQLICPNSSIELPMSVTGGVAPYSYFWNGTQSGANITVNPQTTTTYTAWAVDANGCSSSHEEITVSVAPGINIYAASNISSVCPGESVVISVSVTGGIGGPYNIYDQNGNSVTTPFIYYPAITGSISISAEDGCGSTDHTSIPIEVFSVPALLFSPDISEGCSPLTVQFNETQPELTASVVWDFGDSPNLSLDHNPTHTYTESGSFDVEYQYTSLNGCKTTVVITDLINVFPKPESRFTYDPQTASIIKPEINFYNQSSGAMAYQWHFGDGDSASYTDPTHLYKAEGNYTITMIAITDKGCKDTSVSSLKIAPEFTIFVPTAFSPDGDGVNDYFFVSGHGIDPAKYNLLIYDRFGETVFETDKFDEFDKNLGAWDGRIKNNNIAPVGTYTYLLIYYNTLGNKEEVAGTVTIIR